ncbi:MAG: APC family permease [Candidatus Polarisedimenticolia bacterium]
MPPPDDPPSTGAAPASPGGGASIRVRRGLRFLPLVGLVYTLSAGGTFGPEEIVAASGPALAILLILVMPIFYGLPLGLAAGEMASRFPVEGGYYRWIRRIFGDFWGFQAGWAAWLGAFCDGAVYAVFAAEYFEALLKSVLPEGWAHLARHLFVFVIIATCTLANLRGIHLVGWTSVMFNLFALSPFLLMSVLGVFQWSYTPFVWARPEGQGWMGSLGVGALVAMWCYSGYESLSTAAEELEDPRRNYVRAILISILITVPIYLLPLMVGLATTPDWTKVEAGFYTQIAWAIGGAGLGTWVAASGMLCNINLFNAYTLAYSRIPFAMAQDGFMPKVLARTHARFGTPWVSILAGAVIYGALTRLDLQTLLVVEMWLFSLIYILIYLALWRIRCRPELDVPAAGAFRFTIPGGRLGIWLVIAPPMLLILAAMFFSGAEYILWGGPALLSGVVLYPLALRLRRRHAAGIGGR